MRPRSFRRTALATTAAFVAFAYGRALLPARAQEPRAGDAGGASGAQAGAQAGTTAAESRKVRGVLAWRRAVWSSDLASYEIAAKAFEEARAAGGTGGGTEDDVTLLFLLGHCYTRLGQGEKAAEPLRTARELAPTFPGHWLGEALRMTADKPGHVKSERTAEALPLLDRYLVEIARYDRKAPFAAELEYLGWLERGLRFFAIDSLDKGVRDLTRAAEIVRAEGRVPSAELTRTLSECHKKLGELGLADGLIREALRRDPGEPSHYHVLGVIAAFQHQKDAARALWDGAVERRPEYADPRVRLAYLEWEAGNLYAMRCQLEAFEAAYSARWAAAPQTRDANIASNLHSAYGTYWLARGDRLADAGDLDAGRRLWARARDRYLQSLAENPGCIRALAGLIQVLPQLGAPADEVERWKQKLLEIRENRPDAATAHHDTFC